VFEFVSFRVKLENGMLFNQFIGEGEVYRHLPERGHIIPFVVYRGTHKGHLVAGGQNEDIFELPVGIHLVIGTGSNQARKDIPGMRRDDRLNIFQCQWFRFLQER